jgi:hypothetical protein
MQYIMEQSTSCRREDEWRYGDGGRRRGQMTMVADNDDTHDWAADCNGRGREQAVRDGGDSGVVMMAGAVEEGGGRQQRQRQTTTAANDSGMQDWATNYEGEGQEQVARDGRDTGWQ